MPDLPLATIVGAAFVVVLAYTVFGLTGFGAAIVGVPLLAHFFPIRFAVPMMLVFDLCAGLLLQHSLLRLALVLLPCAVAGYFIGSHLHRRLRPRQAARVIWMLLLASGASLLWRAASLA